MVQRVVGDPSKPVETRPSWLGGDHRGDWRSTQRGVSGRAPRIASDRSSGSETRLEARVTQPCRRAATGRARRRAHPRSQAGVMPRLLPKRGRDVSELPGRLAGAMSVRSGRDCRRRALSGARDNALAVLERSRVGPRARTRDRPSVVTIGVRSAAGPSRWYLNCPCCGLTITPKVRSQAIRQCPRCLARTSTTVELFSSRLPADVLYAGDSLPNGGAARGLKRWAASR